MILHPGSSRGVKTLLCDRLSQRIVATMRFDPALRSLDIYQLAFNVFACLVLLSRPPSGVVIANFALAAFVFFGVPILRRSAHPLWRAVSDLYFLPACMFYYLETSALHTTIYGNRTVDWLLSKADIALFGREPSELLVSAFPNVLLAELMSASYLSFYVFVIAACVLTWRPTERNAAHASIAHAMSLMFVSCYVIYSVVPTAGPRYFFPHETSAIRGAWWCTNLVEHMLAFGERATGAFPSSHVASVVILASWCRRFYPRVFPFTIALALLLTLSTVYLREHFAIDALGGAIYGWGAWRVSSAILLKRPATITIGSVANKLASHAQPAAPVLCTRPE